MRLYELITTKKDVVQHNKTYDVAKMHDLGTDIALSGEPNAGAFAQFHTSPEEHETNDPETHTTGQKSYYAPPAEVDGYIRYIEAIIDSGEMGANPYFPRVYQVTTHRDRRGVEVPSFKIEKLTPGTEIPSEELLAVEEAMFGDLPYYDPRKVYKDDYEFRRIILRTIAKRLRHAVNIPSVVIGEQLRNAIALITEVIKTCPQSVLDIHSDNFMFRRTKYGVQLVITDPVCI